MEKSVHRNVSCEACHVQEVGGYQLTFWAPGNYWGVLTPLTKINYYGALSNPILIKDQARIWIPVKPVPHAVLNMKKELNRTGIEFRNIPGLRNDSRDAYAVVGTFSNLPENNKAILWIHMDKISHGFGKARECLSCHASKEQKAYSTWTMFGTEETHVFPELSKPFYGRHEIVANSSGLYVINIRNTTEIASEDLKYAVNFAPWLYGLEWNVFGDFAIPKLNDKRCEEQCEKCHSLAHAIITPKYMKVKPFLTGVFLIALLGFIILIYSAIKKETR
jgi:hypothetical protein